MNDQRRSQEFKDAMEAGGLIPPAEIVGDGKFHRCADQGHPDKQNGSYILHLDDIAVGSFHNWAGDSGWQTWHEGMSRTLSIAEQAALHAEMESMKKQRDSEEMEIRADAQRRAHRIWESAPPCTDHPYLTKKGIQAHDVRLAPDGSLIILANDMDGIMHTLQFIDGDGNKRFLTGGRVRGCFHMIGESTSSLYICEGFATGASIHEATGCGVIVAFNCGNLLPVAQAIRERCPDYDLVFCADDDYHTDGNPGVTAARAAALAVKGRYVRPDFGSDRPEGATDFNDMAQAQGLDAVRLCIEEAPAEVEPETDAEATKRCAAMSLLEYDRLRKSEAAALGVRVSELDKAVNQARGNQPTQGNGHAVTFEEVEPWDEPVDAAALLDELRDTVHRFIVCDSYVAVAAALWIAFTWFINFVQVAPIAAIVSPEKRCGKTQLLDVFRHLSYRVLVASNISSAAVFRTIEAYSPTLLIDEADSFLKGNEEMRGVLNSGHTRQSAVIIRLEAVGDSFEPRQYSTWSAKAVASIGPLQGTIMDRSIVLPLRRKLSQEKVERLRHADPDHFTTLVRKLARLLEDHGQDIAQARPALPEELNDRAQDSWEPLLAIADFAGGEWPRLARTAALSLSGAAQEAMSTSTELLGDIKEAFGQLDKMPTDDLLGKLVLDGTKLWATYAHGKPMKARDLAKRLKEFSIESQQFKYPGNVVQRGYRLSQFQDAFTRYLTHPAGGAGTATTLPSSADTHLQVADQVAVASGSAIWPKKKTPKSTPKKPKY